MKPLFLQAFEGTNKTVPVWFMRQAGRFLPQYRALKEKYSLNEMFQTPELASEITVQPIDALGVDAAILFADILTLPSAMGFNIKFSNTDGPVIDNSLGNAANFKNIHDLDDLSFVEKTIKLVNARLPDNIPLIGFAGSPFTVLSYLVEGGSSLSFAKLFKFLAEEPQQFHRLMEILTKNTIDYLNLQKKAGIKAFQIFDTWGGILRPSDYAHFVLPYVKEIFEKVDLPSIYYVKNCSHLLALMEQTDADFLSVCHTVVLGHNSILEKTQKGVQGNLFNGIFYAPSKNLEKEVRDVLLGAQHYKKYIFNLSHGILPDTDVSKVKSVVELVHKFKWQP
ncbi:MAG: uroporphyrinogen decarboxylase [Candidatus Omnitrophota bacterium]